MTTRYVNRALGTNTGAATAGGASAWATLSYAVGGTSALAPGDTLLLQDAANYTERVVVKVSGTAGNPITIKADTGDTPVLEGVSGQEEIIFIGNGIEYITLSDGLYFSYGHGAPGGNRKFNWLTIAGNDTNHIIVENCTFERTPWSDLADLAADVWKETAVRVANAKDVTIDNVIIRGVRFGISLDDQCMRATVQNCDIGPTGQSNIVVGSGGTVERGIVIKGNYLHHSAQEDGIQFAPPYPISDADKAIDTSNRGTLILYNEFYGHGENGVDCKSTHCVVIEGNIFYGIAGSNDGFHPTLGNNRNSQAIMGAGANTYSEFVIVRNNIIYDCPSGVACRVGWKVYNNTFVYLRRDYTGPGSTLAKSTAFFQGRNSDPYSGVRNNIFSNNKYDSEVLGGVNQPTNEVDLDYNLYASLSWRDASSSTVYTTLAAWRAKLATRNWRYGDEANSIALAGTTLAARHAAIKFVSVTATPTGVPGDYDFGLQADSPAKGTGGHLTLTNGGGTGTTITVDDSTWFSSIFGRTDKHVRDRIFLNGQERTITAVNHAANQVTVNATMTWLNDQPVHYVLPTLEASATPDIGALNYLVADGGGDPPPPPPPGGPGGRATVRGALNTTTGNQTFTFATPLTGTPTAWRFTLSEATADDTPADGAIISRGWAWDNGGTIVQGAANSRSRNAQATSSTSHRTITDGCVVLPQHTSTAIDGQASFVSGDASGVTINITDAFSAAFLLTVTAFVADAAYFGTVAISQTQDTYTTVTPGFTPNYIEVATLNRAIPDAAGAVRLSHGFATWDGAAITQQCMILSERNSVSPSQICAYLSDAYVGGNISDATGALLNGLQISNMGSTDFRLNTKAGAHSEADAEAFVFCLLFDQEVYSAVITTPTSTNSAYDYAIGFSPGSADVIATTITAVNTAVTSGDAGAYAPGVWDGVSQYSISIADEDNVATTNTQSQNDDRFVNLDKHDGTAGYVAAIVGAVEDNLQLNFSTVPGVAHKWILVAVGEPFIPTVTAAFSGTPLTGDAPLEVAFTDESTEDGTTITTWAWDFGDGATSTSQNPTHTYTVAGLYSVTLTVTDGVDATSTLIKTEYVNVSEAPTEAVTTGSLVLASASFVPKQILSDVLASVKVIS